MPRLRLRSSERGAVLIQVAVCLLGLLAFTAFVLDYGVMWAGRGQAQTAADAGALAGAISLAFDSSTDFAAARERARATARENAVWGEAPDVQLADITFPPCPPGAPGLPDTCVQVNAFRNQVRGNALPTFFANLVGVSSQGVRATATAQIITGNSTDCLKPWAVIDRWDEFSEASGEPDYPNPDPDFTANSTYDRYSTGQGNDPPQENDLYVPPSATSSGTGFSLPGDEGRQFAIKVGANDNSVSSGWFRAIDLPRTDTTNLGAQAYSSSITTCNGYPSSYASPETVCPADIGNGEEAYWAERGCYRVQTGNMVGPTGQGIAELYARDPGARWSGSGIVGSAFSPSTSSPRVVPVGLLDIDAYLAPDPTGANGIVRMVNIFGFFIEGMGDVDANGNISCCSGNGRAVVGRIMTIPAMARGTSNLTASASFLNSIILVR